MKRRFQNRANMRDAEVAIKRHNRIRDALLNHVDIGREDLVIRHAAKRERFGMIETLSEYGHYGHYGP